MSWYAIATEEVNLTIMKVMEQNHPELYNEGVTITALIARSEEGPAIKVRGCEAAGCIRITKLAERTLGLGDAVMILDGERLDAWTSKRLQAVIDHELRHLVLAKSKKTGQVQRDDQDRPKLKIRQHDFEFGWFARTAELYGEDSYEVSQAREIVSASWVQPLLPGLDIEPELTGPAAQETAAGLKPRKMTDSERRRAAGVIASSLERVAALSSEGTKPKRSRKKEMAVA